MIETTARTFENTRHAESAEEFIQALPAASNRFVAQVTMAKIGTSAATVFPGLGGVVESLDEEKYWPKAYLYSRSQYHSDFWSPAEDDI